MALILLVQQIMGFQSQNTKISFAELSDIKHPNVKTDS